jgi:hypothetical protein
MHTYHVKYVKMSYTKMSPPAGRRRVSDVSGVMTIYTAQMTPGLNLMIILSVQHAAKYVGYCLV